LKALLDRPVRLATLLCVFGLATASAASAATISFNAGTMTFNAAPGEVNHVSVDQGGTSVAIGDVNATTADTGATGAGCTQDNADTVTCPNVTAIVINLGDMDDLLASSGNVTISETVDAGDGNDCSLGSLGIHGGLGNDVIHGGPGDDCVYGDPAGTTVTGGGNDQVFGDAGDDFVAGGRGNDLTSGGDGADFVTGGPGTDTVNGDAGDDRLEGGPGLGTPADSGDVISGGAGIDTFEYFHNSSDNTSLVTLSIDDQANDGLPGENDDILSDVEDIQADGSNPTTLIGSAATNVVNGGSGNDTIQPAAGNDFVFANDGDDTIDAVDGYADRVDCGSGNDVASVDEFDQVSGNCETVHRTTLGALATEDNPPTIAWVTPAENAVMSTTAPNTLSVNASDDKGISKVVFLDGERILCTVTAAPYTCAYKPIGADVGKDTLTAMVIDTRQQSATALRTVTVPRFTPSKVNSKTTPSRDSTAPFTFKTSGTVVLPSGVTPGLGCHGVVTVVFKAGGKTVSARNANLSRTCRFSRKVTFRLSSRLHPKSLKVEVKFRGNAVLSAKSAKRRHVKVT
jgi:Ca2+-binding RTX toxin-like protein